ncbi:hypothetical protein NL676_007157 [Syzygium grande]|nr:hypothetical protein NL676_007157 [Syzygium grande]
MQKRALPSSSSGQPSQPKRPCFPPTDQAWKGVEANIMPCRCLTKEDVRSVVRGRAGCAKSHSAECQCCTGHAFEEKVQRMLSTIEYAVQKLNQALSLQTFTHPTLQGLILTLRQGMMIGLKVASGYCGNTRIREAKTDAFPVKEHRGESYKKHYPPASDDEIWRLKKIAKDGKFHQKLSEAGIKKVEDFLLQLYTNSKKLREIIGKSIIPKNWDILVDHAKTCKIDRKLYLYYSDGMRKHGAVFNIDCQLIGLIKDGVYLATDWLSAQDKERGDTIVKMALDNLNDVSEFNGETFSGSMQKESSSYFPSQVFVGQFENPTPFQRYLAPPILPAPVGPEAPLTNAGFTAEGLNGATASTLPVQSQNTNSGNSMEISVDENFHLAAQRPCMVEEWLADGPSYNDRSSKTPSTSGTSRGVIGWLKIKAALQWGFIRKRGVRLAELGKPPMAVRACS